VVVLVHPLQSITLSTALVALFANQVGGIVPDIDQPTAPFWRNLPIGHVFGKTIDKLLGGHRFISHSIAGVALFSFLVNLLLHFLHPIMPNVNIGYVWWAFFIGMLSHLVMDTLTKEGVPWLLPIPFKFGFPPIKKFRITTGHNVEKFIVFPLLLLVDVWLCAHHYNSLVTFVHQHLAR
jgi:inner membrane protein